MLPYDKSVFSLSDYLKLDGHFFEVFTHAVSSKLNGLPLQGPK